MSNKERLIANNAKIEEIRQTLARKQVSPTDMLQARVDGDNSCKYLFYSYDGEDLSFIKGLDTKNVTNMFNMFSYCTNLTSLDLSNFNTSNVTTMTNMFYGSTSLTSLDLTSFNTEKVDSMAAMFDDCINLTSLDLSSFDTSNVTNMNSMFHNCSKLTSLDLSNFNTSKVILMNGAFNNCKKLTSLDLSNWNTSEVSNMGSMFRYCSSLTSLNLSSFNTKNVTTMTNLFDGCTKLSDIVGSMDLIKATSLTNFCTGCPDLTNVTLKNIKKSITLGSGTSYGTKLSNATLINTIQQLWDLTGSTSQTLTLSTTSKENIANIYVKLVDVTDEMLATDPNAGNKKPCVVCESTDEGAMTITEYLISKNWSLA